MTQAPQGYAFAAVSEDDQGQAHVLMDYGVDEPFVFALPAANPKKPVRFAVGRPGLRSSLWRLWANPGKDDVYLATRQSAGIFKISLHESGDWRLQWVGQDRGDATYTSLTDPEPEGRVLHKWTRPQPGPAGWTDALSIWVVDVDVAEIPGDVEPGHDAQWMQPAPAGGAVEFRIVLARPGPVVVDLSAAVEKPGSGLAYVNGFRLAGGEAVLLFAATTLLDEAMLADIARFRQEHRMTVGPDFDLSPETGPRAAVITSDDDGYKNIWDLSLSRPRTRAYAGTHGSYRRALTKANAGYQPRVMCRPTIERHRGRLAWSSARAARRPQLGILIQTRWLPGHDYALRPSASPTGR